ncbi:Ubiquitin carboxyl-terminal hydrolase FAF [Heracleum sosnowskyi]|uniref:Ubiquitin carboxyl-terminal hydrolase FAF n=1 Tax=Heracleum sosnowskyi TaxID=360622 RepID=A0AAD8HUV9_9APIA|nr:Ubiquitin carboxyl-terminal hydrolase FAF [Heracleum sosnowskyi]
MATETKSSVVKVRPTSNQIGSSSSSKPKNISSSSTKILIFGNLGFDYVDCVLHGINQIGSSSSSNPKNIPLSSTKTKITSTTVTKTEVKGKFTSGSSSKTTSKVTTTTVKKREKKVYSLAGQKYDPPEEREPLRIFYESLSKQIPSSEMAEFWMMEHGLLSPDKAKKAYEKKQRKQKQLRLGTPIKSPPPPPSRGESSKRPQQSSKNGDAKAKKRIIDDSDDDDDVILSHKRRKG